MDREFLRMCGFAGADFEKEGPRVDRAFGILEIGPEDIDQAKENLTKYFSVDLEGMRKVWGIALKELTDLVLAKEEGKKVIYGSYPPLSVILAAGAVARDDIYCAPPEAVVSNFMVPLFGQKKINPFLETAESHGLGLSFNSCSYLKVRLGGVISRKIPVPDLLLSFCFLCDQTPKTDEILNDLYGVPIAYVDNIFEDKGDRWPQEISPRRVQYFAKEIKACAEKFSEVIGYELSEERVLAAMHNRDGFFQTFDQLFELMKADPMPFSHNDLIKVSHIVYGCVRRGLLEGPKALAILRKELEERIRRGVGVTAKGAPKILMYLVPHNPAWASMIEGLGLAISVTTMVSTPGASAPSSYPSVWEQTADSLMRTRGNYYSSWAAIRQLKELAELWDVDGAIVFVHTPCRQRLLHPLKEKMVVEEELGIPVLIIEGDYVDSRNFNEQQVRTRLETFAEIVKNARAGKRK
jgi:benzoyl-CoA reductase/2-hydroxyglutaryl-CoA dehydratase subunit BcrC/BadD/HgdB